MLINKTIESEIYFMKAIECTKYGSPEVLQLRDVEKPAPKDNEILIRIHAASVNPADWHHMHGTPAVLVRPTTGLRKHKDPRLGIDLAGQVEAVGRDVTQFQPGDDVFGPRHGALAEYVCTQGKAFVLKPAKLTFEQAAAIPVAGLTALQGLRDKGQLQPGQKVLINGAAGGVGTFAVQIAKAFGAEVTAVCSTQNVDLVRSLGADHVIDYTREDFTRSGRRYDLIFDNMGNHSLSAYRRILTPKGTYVMVGAEKDRWIKPLPRLIGLFLLSRFVSQKMVFFISTANKEDMSFLKALSEAGKLTPVLDRCYPLEQASEAMRYLGKGHARGKVIVTVNHHSNA